MRIIRSCLTGLMFAVVSYLSTGVASADTTYWVHLTITWSGGAGAPPAQGTCSNQFVAGSPVTVSAYSQTAVYSPTPCVPNGFLDNPGYWNTTCPGDTQNSYMTYTALIDKFQTTKPTDTTTGTTTLTICGQASQVITSVWTTVSIPSNTLTVAGAGNGGGTITGSGLNCIISGNSSAGTCSQNFPAGTQVSLTATADPTSTFTNWSGCDVPVLAVCNLTMKSGGQQVTAFFSSSNLRIIKPTDSNVFSYNSTYISTDQIAFQADPGAGNGGATVSWTAALEYATTGGKYAYTDSSALSTVGNANTTKTYTSTGGKITINASTTRNGQLENANPVTVYVEGVAIPQATITDKLVSLYSGPLHTLLTGLADKESCYLHFRSFKHKLYNKVGLWPNEPVGGEGGSHVGLMMVVPAGPKAFEAQKMGQTAAQVFWNWEENAANGAAWLTGMNSQGGEKMGIAKHLVRIARKMYPSLPDLTPAQYEQYAVELYGNHPGTGVQDQYWVPVPSNPNDPNSAYTWQVGTANLDGKAYTDDVYARAIGLGLCRR